MLLHIPTKTYLHIVSISEHVITEFKIGTGNGQMAKAVTRLVHMLSLKKNITLVHFLPSMYCSIQVNQATSGNLHKFEHFCAL